MSGEHFIVEAAPLIRGTTNQRLMQYSTAGIPLYPPKVINPLQYDISIGADSWLAGEALRRSGSIQIQIDEDENDIGNLNFGGQYVGVKQGSHGDTAGSYSAVLNARMDEVRWDQTNLVNITMKTSRESFRKQVIGGAYSGLPEADKDLNGQNKPLCFGICQNVLPTLIDSVNLVYQVHDGPIDSIDAVYFNGYPATLTTDYTVDLAAGTFQLTGSPLGTVTADVKGDNNGGFSAAQYRILQRIAADFAGWDAGFDSVAFSQTDPYGFNFKVGGNCGLYIGTGEFWTLEDVCRFLIQGSSGYWSVNTAGEMVINAAYNPHLTSPKETWTDADFDSIRFVKAKQPYGKFRIKHSRNWHVMFDSDIAGALVLESTKPLPDDDRATFLRNEWRMYEDDRTSASYPDAPDWELDSPYWTEVDALRALDNMAALFTQIRDVYEVTRMTTDLSWNLFDVVRIEYPFWGLDSGKNFFIIGISPNMQNGVVRYTLWG